MPSFPANISAPSPRIAPRSRQDVMNYSQLCIAPKISADGAGTGQNGPNAIAKFVVMAQRNKRFIKCQDCTSFLMMCSNFLFRCAITTNYHRTADP